MEKCLTVDLSYIPEAVYNGEPSCHFTTDEGLGKCLKRKVRWSDESQKSELTTVQKKHNYKIEALEQPFKFAKKPRVDWALAISRKSNQEKARRQKINACFEELGDLVESQVSLDRKSDRFGILGDAIQYLQDMQSQNGQLRQLNSFLLERITMYETERRMHEALYCSPSDNDAFFGAFVDQADLPRDFKHAPCHVELYDLRCAGMAEVGPKEYEWLGKKSESESESSNVRGPGVAPDVTRGVTPDVARGVAPDTPREDRKTNDNVSGSVVDARENVEELDEDANTRAIREGASCFIPGVIAADSAERHTAPDRLLNSNSNNAEMMASTLTEATATESVACSSTIRNSSPENNDGYSTAGKLLSGKQMLMAPAVASKALHSEGAGKRTTITTFGAEAEERAIVEKRAERSAERIWTEQMPSKRPLMSSSSVLPPTSLPRPQPPLEGFSQALPLPSLFNEASSYKEAPTCAYDAFISPFACILSPPPLRPLAGSTLLGSLPPVPAGGSGYGVDHRPSLKHSRVKMLQYAPPPTSPHLSSAQPMSYSSLTHLHSASSHLYKFGAYQPAASLQTGRVLPSPQQNRASSTFRPVAGVNSFDNNGNDDNSGNDYGRDNVDVSGNENGN